MSAFRIEVLRPAHQRAAFTSGVAVLDRYLREQASQDVRKRASVCYVALAADAIAVAGYYTLSAGSVLLPDVPPSLAKHLARYPAVPVARLGRLAVDARWHGQRLGAALLWDATARACRAELGVVALIVDAKDEAAAAFYRHHGFTAFESQARQLMLPLAGVAASLAR